MEAQFCVALLKPTGVSQAEEVEVQTTRVKLLEADVASGRAAPEALQEESSALQGLKARFPP